MNWNSIGAKALRRLQDYLRISTVNPPGRTAEAVRFWERLCREEGLPSRRYVADAKAGKENLLARLSARHPKRRPLILLNHMDVVPADPRRWKVPPFAGKVSDGEIWGRGALDMKGLGILQLTAMSLLKPCRERLDRDILLLCVCDEEAGGECGTEWMTRRHFGDLRPSLVLEEGGWGSQGILTRDARPVFAVSVVDKAVCWLKLTARGRAGHASLPNGENPNEILAAALVRLRRIGGIRRDSPVFREMRKRLGSRLRPGALLDAASHDTLSVTVMRSGSDQETPRVNMIPGRAEATLDCRLTPATRVKEFLRRVRKAVADPRVRVEILKADRVTPSSSWETPEFQAIERAAKRLYPASVTAPLLMPMATDSRFFRKKGVPAYGLMPMILTAEEIARIHGDNERISIRKYQEGIRILFEIVKEITVD